MTRLVPGARAPAHARQLVRDFCEHAGVAAGVSEMVVLLTSETVTNSVLHGRGAVQVNATTSPGCVRVEVADGSRRAPVTTAVEDGKEHGRGLLLLEQCSSAWGVDVRRRGKTVWFEVLTG